ncbi:hypothetical protein NAD41_002359 [Salmonella enterica]|nr:hypothetical protein [Salmonella enterica]EKK6596327.1 hypothetical protein [Salmonella enterica]
MSATLLPDLMERWKAQRHARLRNWQGFRLPQRGIAKKSRKVQRTMMQGIYPRGKTAAQLVWMHRNERHYL